MQGCSRRYTGVDFVTAERSATRRQAGIDPAQLLVRAQFRLQPEKSESFAAARFPFDTEGVGDNGAQHLVAAADADELAAVTQVPLQGRDPVVVP